MSKVLLVEDDIFISELYERAFKNAGIDFDLVQDGQKGLEMAKTGSYELILLDIMLPSLSGIDLLKELKNVPDFKMPKVILLTNLAKESIIRQGYEYGAVGHILKSKILPRMLVQTIRTFNETGKLDNNVPGVFSSPPSAG